MKRNHTKHDNSLNYLYFLVNPRCWFIPAELIERVHDKSSGTGHHFSINDCCNIGLGLSIETGEIIRRSYEVYALFKGLGNRLYFLHSKGVVLNLEAQIIKKFESDSFP